MNKKIALSGVPFSGKTALARYLQQYHGYELADHGRLLILSFVSSYNRAHPHSITIDDVYANKDVFRRAVVEHANQEGFHAVGRADYWIGGTLSRVDKGKPIVFDSYRGLEQAKALTTRGFTLVEIMISEEERRARVGNDEKYEALMKHVQDNHDVEAAHYARLTIYKNTLPEMAKTLEMLA